MKPLFRSAALALLFLAAACSSSPHQRVPFPAQDVTVTQGDLTRIYFVRDGWVGIGSRDVEVIDGETEIGVVTPDTYLCWERPPGRTLGRVFYYWGPGRGKLEGVADFDCAAGSAYYYKVTVEREGGKPTAQILEPAEGRKLVAERKPVGKS